MVNDDNIDQFGHCSYAGIKFFKENLQKLEDENIEHMPIGFEVAFPSVLEIARSLKLDVPDNSPVLHKIYACRNLKLTKQVLTSIFSFFSFVISEK